MQPRNCVAEIARPITELLAIACGWVLMAISALTCVEIVGRKLFGKSLQGVDELGGYTLAIVASIGFAQALVTRSHTRIDFLIVKLGAKARAWLNVFAIVTLALMAVFAAWKGSAVLLESIEFRSRSTSPLQTPMWIPQGLWLVGLAVFAAVSAALATHACLLLAARLHDEINALYGPPSLEEEIDREVDVLKRRIEAEP